jgi:hypothetical protein
LNSAICQQVLYQSGDELSFIYFPITEVVSLLHILENGDSTEIAMTGREGVVGISVFYRNSATTPVTQAQVLLLNQKIEQLASQTEKKTLPAHEGQGLKR